MREKPGPRYPLALAQLCQSPLGTYKLALSTEELLGSIILDTASATAGSPASAITQTASGAPNPVLYSQESLESLASRYEATE